MERRRVGCVIGVRLRAKGGVACLRIQEGVYVRVCVCVQGVRVQQGAQLE